MTAKEIRVYFEGNKKLRNGFRRFLRTAGSDRINPIACGNRDRALKSFANSLADHQDAVSILLVDAEDVVRMDGKPWEHLQSLGSGRLTKPNGAVDEDAHLMVQVMESWFIADKETLKEYYGTGFLANRLPATSSVEGVPKASVMTALHDAVAKTSKGSYQKSVHAPELLALIDPAKVRAASRWCDRLFTTIESIIESA